MKRIITLLLVLIGLNGTAQVVDGINYQAVALDEDGREIPGTDINGNVLAESMFDLRFTIRSATNDGTIEYQETHADVNTDNFGLFTVVIGHGSTTTLSPVAMLNDIDWGADKHFLEVEIDLEKDGNYKLMSNQQMMAVPYAFYALNTGDVEWGNISDVPADLLDGDNVDDADNDPTNELQDWSTLPGIPADILDGDNVDDADNDPTNELQTWSTLPGIPVDLADGIDNVDDADNDPTNELQIISISNDTIYLTNGGFAVIPQSTSVDWTNITNIPADILDGDNVNDADSDPTNELQTWSTLPGIPVDLADGIDNVDDADNDPTNEITTVTDNGDGTSTLTDALGGTVTIDNDGIDNVDDADNDPANELQALSLSNDTLYLSNGNNVFLGNLNSGGSNISPNYGPIPHWISSTGNCKDGSFSSTGNVTMAGVKEYCNFSLNSGHTLTISGGSFLLLRVKDTLRINGTINGTGAHNGGGKGGAAGGASSYRGCVQQSGASSSVDGILLYSGGVNNVGEDAIIDDATSLIDFGMSYSGLFYGAKGGNGDHGSCTSAGTSAGGKGGAGIIIVCNYLEFTGSIIADGQQGVYNPLCGVFGAGGGGAGVIAINAQNIISNTGTTSNLGGAGGAGACSTLTGKNGYRGGDAYTIWIGAQ